MRKLVFLGPSLAPDEAKAICGDAIYLPPPGQADFLSAIHRFKPDIVGLIDGVFQQDLSIWHKEILFALERGIIVLGASSMGALRAAETNRFGMIGIGEIYRMYADGTLADDDEVALVHGPADSGFLKITEPMVNVRATLARATETGAISTERRDEVLARAKAIHFTERNWPGIFAGAKDAEAMKRYVRANYVDQKKLDAVTLLERIEAIAAGEKAGPAAEPFALTQSMMFQTLYNRDRTVEAEGTILPLYEIAEHAALHRPDFARINEAALDRALVAVLAELTGIAATEAELETERARFTTRRGLTDAAALDAWLSGNHLDDADFQALIGQLALRRKLHAWYLASKPMEKNTRGLLDELRIRGAYPDATAEAALHHHLAEPALNAGLLREKTDLATLTRQHAEETGLGIDASLTDWANHAGFRNLEDLRLALLRSKAARDAMREMLDAIGTAEVEGT